MDEEVIQK